MRGRPVVLGYYFTDDVRSRGKLPPTRSCREEYFEGRNISAVAHTPDLGRTSPNCSNRPLSAGHFNTIPDVDGVYRRVPMLAEYEGAYYRTLVARGCSPAAGLACRHTRIHRRRPLSSGGYPGLEWLEIGRSAHSGRHRGNGARALSRRRTQLSLRLSQRCPEGQGGSRPCWRTASSCVGATAPGLLDLRSTPVDAVYPGVEIHANLIAGMLDGTAIKQRPPTCSGPRCFLLFLSGVVMALVLPLLSPLRGMLVTALVLVAVFGTNLLVWDRANLVAAARLRRADDCGAVRAQHVLRVLGGSRGPSARSPGASASTCRPSWWTR